MNNTTSIRNLIFCSVACLIAISLGGLFQPGEWYTQIKIAPWSPPNIAFPIVWGILYPCIAIAGWRIFNYGTLQLKALWLGQLTLNALWSWLFFGEHWLLVAFIDIAIIITLVSILIIKCWPNSIAHNNQKITEPSQTKSLRLSSYLLIPYVMWLIIAGSLNLYILWAN
jgi:tryptophan-rich sensory protein